VEIGRQVQLLCP